MALICNAYQRARMGIALHYLQLVLAEVVQLVSRILMDLALFFYDVAINLRNISLQVWCIVVPLAGFVVLPIWDRLVARKARPRTQTS